ncbi:MULTISPECIES: glycosyltransferase family 4 protein [unclassified Micromonospora]|uniref:glycosyltransferase family 4 protein n=1 Tax=unclassified Micromonospora TaxID=2617518 RepID=UPI0022B66E59|nr:MULTISPECIES: glycosyltransferase family 4 protein [unclassified Micromonospora]MCZ7420620.1 glycosyltransferase family 4 protein [Verrucosispora sp. WMMA2121]WBB88923.1 glycosyltransferase family 4 protein [Verrucosispora sp. WMMC514]
MRVLFVCTTGGAGRRQLGGAERFLAEMLPALAEQGVEVLAATPDDEVAATLRDSGIRWFRLAATRRVDLDYARDIRRLVDESRPDVVSAHLLSAAMHVRAGLGIKGRQTPLVVALHNSLWQYRDAAVSLRGKAAVQANIALDLIARRLRPHATVAVSAFEAEELRVRGRVHDVRVITNPLPAIWPTADVTSRHPSTRAIRVGFLGRLEREKGVDLITDIADELADAEFLVAGAGTLKIAARPNIRLVGRVDAASFLPTLDCLLVPSRVESFGRSALEAMSLGVPVVHSGVGGLAEITRRGAGVLAYQADLTTPAITAAIRAATRPGSDPEHRRELAQEYASEHSFARCVQNWLDLYRAVSK